MTRDYPTPALVNNCLDGKLHRCKDRLCISCIAFLVVSDDTKRNLYKPERIEKWKPAETLEQLADAKEALLCCPFCRRMMDLGKDGMNILEDNGPMRDDVDRLLKMRKEYIDFHKAMYVYLNTFLAGAYMTREIARDQRTAAVLDHAELEFKFISLQRQFQAVEEENMRLKKKMKQDARETPAKKRKLPKSFESPDDEDDAPLMKPEIFKVKEITLGVTDLYTDEDEGQLSQEL
jgi:hypothetical protein